MATDERLDERLDGAITTWLEQTAPPRLPERVLAATFERTHRSRQQAGWRVRLGRIHMTRPAFALGGAAAVVVAAALALNFAIVPGVGGPVPSADHSSPFLGTWFSNDADGSALTMTIRTSGEDALEIVVLDDHASVCSGAPSTIVGVGRLDGPTSIILPAPLLTCDDGNVPQALSGPPLEEQLRNLTFTHDHGTDTLTDNFGLVWTREGADPSPEPTTPRSEAAVTELLNGFLEARVAGEGAQQYLVSRSTRGL